MADTVILTDIGTSTLIITDSTPSVIISGIQGPPGIDGKEIVFLFTTDQTLTQQVIDSFSYTSYGAAKYIIYATNGVNRQISELLVIHNNSIATLVEYANVSPSTFLATYDVILDSNSVQLKVTPTNINTNFKIIRTLLPS